MAMIHDEALAALEEKKKRTEEVEARFKAGRLLKEDYEALVEFIAENTQRLMQDKTVRMDTIAESYNERFTDAMRRYQERELQYKALS
jgi:hypothetical protein